MKKTNKLFSVVLAIVLVFAMAIPAFAAGEGTITITNAVSGQTYTVYKMFSFTPVTDGDAESEYGFYAVEEAWKDFINDADAGAAYLAVDEANGTIVWVGDASETRKAELAKAAVAYAKDKGIEGVAKDAESATVEFTGLDLGYYAIDTSLGAVCGLTNTNAKFTAHEKNSEVTVDKEVQEDRNNNWYGSNDADIGQTVNFRATITAGSGAENYVFHDKMEAGLTLDATSIKIDGLTAGADYTVKTTDLTDGCTFEIHFIDTYLATLEKDTKIVISYSATLNEKATIGLEDGNENEAWLTYGDDNTTTHDKTTTYTYEIAVNKTDAEGAALPGAGFTLYKWDATIDADSDTEGDEGDWVVVGSEITGVTTFEWKGLDEGQYKLEETTVPAGYNKADDVEFTITASLPAGTSVSADKAFNGGLTANIENLTGGLLPETGGIGTKIFYIVGALLVVGAVVLLITKKRMSAEA